MTEMKKRYLVIFVLILIATLQSCEKSDSDVLPEPVDDQKPIDTIGHDSLFLYQRQLLKVIEWKELTAKARFEYNLDSSIKQIIYSGPLSAYEVSYEYINKRIREVNTAGSLYTNIFEYDAYGRVTSMVRYLRLGDQPRANQQLEFTYHSNNTVSVMKYYQINEAGRELIYTNTYEYDAQNRPIKITGMDKNGNTIVTTIEAFSKPVFFDPVFFMGIDINETYMIYNLPVLSQLKQLPALIKLSRFRNGELYVEKQTTITYTINAGRLEKQVNALKYPEYPHLNQSSEVNYAY